VRGASCAGWWGMCDMVCVVCGGDLASFLS